MSKITVHGWTRDNVGNYHKAGSTLTVDADGGEGCIDAKSAAALVKHNSATPCQQHKAAPAK
jgi:hypothetical protein